MLSCLCLLHTVIRSTCPELIMLAQTRIIPTCVIDSIPGCVSSDALAYSWQFSCTIQCVQHGGSKHEREPSYTILYYTILYYTILYYTIYIYIYIYTHIYISLSLYIYIYIYISWEHDRPGSLAGFLPGACETPLLRALLCVHTYVCVYIYIYMGVPMYAVHRTQHMLLYE